MTALNMVDKSVTLDQMNIYANRKNFAGGLINFALILANANQLRFVIESDFSGIQCATIILISLSIVLQIVAGILTFLDHCKKVQSNEDLEKVNAYNKAISIINMIISVINAIIIGLGGPKMPDSKHIPDIFN